LDTPSYIDAEQFDSILKRKLLRNVDISRCSKSSLAKLVCLVKPPMAGEIC